jgi:fructose-specific phosphotransferase system IIC component
MSDIDPILAHIGQLPLDPRLAGIEAGVMAGLAEARRPAVPHTALGAITGFAMMAGVVAAMVAGAPHGRAGLDPLGIGVALAPSTLLDGALLERQP